MKTRNSCKCMRVCCFILIAFIHETCLAFSVFKNVLFEKSQQSSSLHSFLDPVTSLRTEWISAALCTNQIPRAADVCLQIGTYDGRIVNFVPRTIREIRTSSLQEDGKLTISTQRRLKQAQERRSAAKVTIVQQRADHLNETADESVDVVVSLQAASQMISNGQDWKKSISEAARVLRPGGRFLFVESSEINGERYLDVVQELTAGHEENPNIDVSPQLVFDVAFDEVDLVLTPHVAGVAIKSEQAGLTVEEIEKKRALEESERLADLSIKVFERGIKKRKKIKKSDTKQPVE